MTQQDTPSRALEDTRRRFLLARAQLAAHGVRRRGEVAMRRWRPHRRRFS
ncbi:MAG TPA: hypothetical protein VHJ39_16740 [Solirubrobacteraceae bacterium]|nr:hypothetical protein [Solirubrobacteraceae bacterium]